MLSTTAIVLLDGPRVVIPASLSYFFVMKKPVAPVSNMPMDDRAWYLIPSRCGLSCVL